MRYSIRVTEPPEAWPISLEEAKAHLAIVDDDSRDALIEAMLAAAVEHVERHTSHLLTDRELEIAWPDFPCYPELLSIPREPVTEIVSLIYADADGADVTMVVDDDYRWSVATADQVMPAFRGSWPSASGEAGSVRLRFRAGYGDEEEVAGDPPPALIAAVKLMLGHLFAHREEVVTGTIATQMPVGVEALCAPFRRIAL